MPGPPQEVPTTKRGRKVKLEEAAPNNDKIVAIGYCFPHGMKRNLRDK